MHAAVVNAPGSVPVYAEFAEPSPGPGLREFELVGAGLHQVVRSMAAGAHYGSTDAYPLVPGVDAVGRGDDGKCYYTGLVRAPWGTMAERMVARFGIELPDGADPLAVAAGMNPAGAGWMPLQQQLEARGELGTVAVLGATGMAGRLAVQSALALGASRVVAAGRNAAVLDELEARGAHIVSLVDPGEALAEALRDDPPNLVLDFVWGPVAELAFTALARRGVDEDAADISYVQIGAVAGAMASLPASLLRSRRIRVSGSGAGSASMHDVLRTLPGLVERIGRGELDVTYTPYRLAEVGRAWAHTGPSRAVLTP
ncbi:zinc-binding alcohol dehydrogenase family protein [Agromyces intestinalis]|uniref:Zinc-binding alcohol dehydrogenase family protein n=1 Tax=Agromyces intestinalis TaxID=2592652 RepID=A0A5C1YEQ8_9MICO|nr:zinc-binding dehydrogenase [Agromyces intestinalis]QEO14553.1 zinc-binding alcohol dehydrogenase family protein [Agromyces intestinalis]